MSLDPIQLLAVSDGIDTALGKCRRALEAAKETILAPVAVLVLLDVLDKRDDREGIRARIRRNDLGEFELDLCLDLFSLTPNLLEAIAWGAGEEQVFTWGENRVEILRIDYLREEGEIVFKALRVRIYAVEETEIPIPIEPLRVIGVDVQKDGASVVEVEFHEDGAHELVSSRKIVPLVRTDGAVGFAPRPKSPCPVVSPTGHRSSSEDSENE